MPANGSATLRYRVVETDELTGMTPGFALLADGSRLAGAPAAAQTIVTSPGPDRVAVTVYRDPKRAARAAAEPAAG